jgi:uncharacterized membrane protein
MQRLAGLMIALISAGFIAWLWRTALLEGHFYVKASLLFPALFVLGLGMVLFPLYREERIARGEDISGLKGWELITPRWWIIFAIGMLAAIVNYYLLVTL